MRSHRGLFAVCIAVCIATSNALAAVVDRAIRFALSCIPSDPFNFRMADEPIHFQPAFAYGDPHVTRHEAGMSTRAAARGI